MAAQAMVPPDGERGVRLASGGCARPLRRSRQQGRREIVVTARRTKEDFAAAMRVRVDEWYPEAQTGRIVLDNLNTHTGAALYEAFAPAEARRILARLACHDTPKHGAWLNPREIEWSVLTRQCVGRRIGDAAGGAGGVARAREARRILLAKVRARRRLLMQREAQGEKSGD